MCEPLARLVGLALARPQARIESALGQKLEMLALLDDLAAIEHDDVVGVHDRRQPVRDDERGALRATRSSASWISRSVWLSSAVVASSSIRIGGAFRIVRAIATRCFSPPESFRPRSPTIVFVALRQRADEVVDLGQPRGL